MEEKIPEMQSIETSNIEELIKIAQKMSMMQKTHNKLAEDFTILTNITKQNIENKEYSKPLIRACIKEFFSLVEADLFLINQFLSYPNYSDKDNLSKKFKKTFRNHSDKFKKEKLKENYQSRSYKKLYELKLKRDKIVHPKSYEAIDVNIVDFENIISVFTEYREYIIELMTNIGFKTKIK